MFENITREHSDVLDLIIRERHSVRAFGSTPPDRESIEAIVQAGLLAPFAAFAVGGKPGFRKVFVIQKSSPAMQSASDIIKNRMAKMAQELEKKVGPLPFVQKLKQGVPSLGAAPYFVIVGERKGMPPIAAQSLSYCLQNMWLKATSRGIGFQLVSATMQMDGDSEFCGLLNIPCGEYALDGCALGYPAENFQPAPVEYPTLADSVFWL